MSELSIETVETLRALCKSHGLKGYSKLKKGELLTMLDNVKPEKLDGNGKDEFENYSLKVPEVPQKIEVEKVEKVEKVKKPNVWIEALAEYKKGLPAGEKYTIPKSGSPGYSVAMKIKERLINERTNPVKAEVAKIEQKIKGKK